MMEMEVDNSLNEDYFISKIREARESKDYLSARTWLTTAKCGFPNSFNMELESYKIEMEANNYQAAANSFSFIALSCKMKNEEIWTEINELTAALRAPENEITAKQEFYVKMFQHLSADVQQKILLLTVNNTENNLSQCKLLLMVLTRFPELIMTHSSRLLELITDGISQNPEIYQKMLMDEVIPLLYNNQDPPELNPVLVCRVFTISLEYSIREIMEDKSDANEIWKKIFQILNLCAKILRWETFLSFNKNWGHNIYWEKIIDIIAKSPGGSPQVLFYAITLFIYSLHSYIKHCHARLDDLEINHVLVEGFTEWNVDRSDAQNLEPPQISVTTNASKTISKAFVHAAQCWQLLNTEQFRRDLGELLLKLPIAPWISRFLFDLAMYFGHYDDAKKVMVDLNVNNSLVQNLQILSLNMMQGTLTLQGFECVLAILSELPTTTGQDMEDLSLNIKRHLIFIPLTKNALIQYCVKAIITGLSRKLYEPNCPDHILGSLLVLLQLEYPREAIMAGQIFNLILSRRSFSFKLFISYIVEIDFIEEFMYFWVNYEDFTLDIISPSEPSSHRRSRGTEKGTRDEIRILLRQQVSRANDNIPSLMLNYISQERAQLIENIFGVDNQSAF
ncbi:integrator complex subunit 10 [Teleopsis dalmanni]|uniref:integrator complex subunit 10 n=1 Tax=Teleopsis dalmanni TaxID=139649 RepID=UPI0018CE649F|nr:integrator complex subunit 10 [Teleopsis dalmanni]